MRRRLNLWLLQAAVGLGLAAAAYAATGSAPAPARGHFRVIATVPSPGYPALPFVDGNTIYEGTFTNPAGDSIESKVYAFDSYGKLLRTYTIQGQDLSQAHGVQVANRDSYGNLIVLDNTSGRVLRLSPATGVQSLYSTIPDIPTCSADGNKEPCSQAKADLTTEPDYAAWGPDGSLYITDYQQAVIWRVPPGGGKPVVWLSSPLLDGGIFGTAGLAMLPDHHTLMFDQSSNAGAGGGGNPSTGKLYTVPIGADGKPGPLKEIWESVAAGDPDGFALSRAGNIYIAVNGPSANDIQELSPAGKLIATFGTPVTGSDGTSVPLDEPGGVAFRGTELVIANISYAEGNASHMALLGLGTAEQGQPIYVPSFAGSTAPPHVKKQRAHHRKRRHRRRR